MSGYTPTTDEVRDSLVYLNKYHAKQYGDIDLLVVGSETAAQFDRMIASVERAAAAGALEEAANGVALMGTGKAVAWLRDRAAEIREWESE